MRLANGSFVLEPPPPMSLLSPSIILGGSGKLDSDLRLKVSKNGVILVVVMLSILWF